MRVKITKVDLPVLECKRCGYKWWPRTQKVRMCAKCKSVLWHTPKNNGKKAEAEAKC